jgi:hypothetical protein
VYTALVRQVAAAHEASLPSAPPPSCSSCPNGTAVLAASALTCSSSSGQLPAKQLLQSALAARQLPKPRSAAYCAAALQDNLGSSCKWFCTGCDASWPSNSSSQAAAAAAASGEVAAAVQKALQLWEQLALLQQVMTAAGGAAGAAAAGGGGGGVGRGGAKRGGSSGRGRGGGRGRGSCSSAWAAGTGGFKCSCCTLA